MTTMRAGTTCDVLENLMRRGQPVLMAACLSVVLVAPGTVWAAGRDASDELYTYSNEEYVKRFGEQSARAAGVRMPSDPTAPAVGAVLDPQQPRHKVNWSVRDWDGHDIPTRHGTAAFGWQHASAKHNMRSEKAIDAPYHGRADKVSGTRAEYWGVIATNSGQVRMSTVSVSERGDRGPGGERTPDGRPLGTMTAYCVGQTVCPDWVNDL
ncbi:hypothetical protein PL81_39300 [Streptomyces sp. RSD-27]|nr:hypothetical protein PL81_39300 [Streptomyces sp. RSD-27]